MGKSKVQKCGPFCMNQGKLEKSSQYFYFLARKGEGAISPPSGYVPVIDKELSFKSQCAFTENKGFVLQVTDDKCAKT